MPSISKVKHRGDKQEWTRLHSALRDTYSSLGLQRMVAVLDNFADKKEVICRRLGVVCNSDISRIVKGLKKSKISTSRT
jgi:hypothetical protein